MEEYKHSRRCLMVPFDVRRRWQVLRLARRHNQWKDWLLDPSQIYAYRLLPPCLWQGAWNKWSAWWRSSRQTKYSSYTGSILWGRSANKVLLPSHPTHHAYVWPKTIIHFPLFSNLTTFITTCDLHAVFFNSWSSLPLISTFSLNDFLLIPTASYH